MTDPLTTTTTATTTAVIVAAPLLALEPTLGAYGIIMLSAMAGAFVRLGAIDLQATAANTRELWRSVLSGVIVVLRIVLVSLALTGSLSFLVAKYWALPAPVVLALVSFGLALMDGQWATLRDGLLSYGLRRLPGNAGEPKP